MINAIVMAAGKGTRMNSEKTKTMHEVLGKPMVGHIYDTLKQVGAEKIVFVVGCGFQQIQEYLQDKVSYAIQQPQLGSGHAVSQATILSNQKGKTLIINGDCPLITKETYMEMIDAANDYDLVVLSMKLSDALHYGRIKRDDKGNVLRIVERKDCNDAEVEIKEANVGIYCVDNELLWKYLPEIDNHNAQGEYYITDLVEIFNKHNLKVGAFIGKDNSELLGINDREELAVANKTLQKRVNTYWMKHGVTIIDPNNTYISCDASIGKDTTIYPNCRIEANSVIGQNNIIESDTVIINSTIGDNNHIISSRIDDCSFGNNSSLGPNSSLRGKCKIGDNCRIGCFVEMKNVVFGNGSKAAHLTYIGDADVGEKCNFGCGVVTVNYDGKNKYHTTIKDHVFVGSNVNIIAPVTIESETVLAAGTTVTKDVNTGEMAIGRVRQENKAEFGFKYLNKR